MKYVIIITCEAGNAPSQELAVELGKTVREQLQCDNTQVLVSEAMLLSPITHDNDTIVAIQEEAIREVATYIQALVLANEAPIVLAAKLQRQVCEGNEKAINAVELIKNTKVRDVRIKQLGIPYERIVAIRTVQTD